jgi:hypothetical protein
MKTNIQIWSYLTHLFLEREMFRTNVVEEIKTHILCSVIVFSKNRAVYTVEKYDTAVQTTDDVTRHVRIACWINEATNTHSEYVILIACPLQQWLHKHASRLHTLPVLSSVGSAVTREKI